MMVKISSTTHLSASEILFIAEYKGNKVVQDVKDKKKVKMVHDFSSPKRTLCVIYLKSGHLVLCPIARNTVLKRYREATEKPKFIEVKII